MRSSAARSLPALQRRPSLRQVDSAAFGVAKVRQRRTTGSDLMPAARGLPLRGSLPSGTPRRSRQMVFRLIYGFRRLRRLLRPPLDRPPPELRRWPSATPCRCLSPAQNHPAAGGMWPASRRLPSTATVAGVPPILRFGRVTAPSAREASRTKTPLNALYIAQWRGWQPLDQGSRQNPGSCGSDS